MGAAAAVAGQNLGAGRPTEPANGARRGRFGLRFRFRRSTSFFLPAQLLAVFDDHPVVMTSGIQLLRVLSFSGLLISVALTYTGGFQGTGDTKSPLYISIVSQVVFRCILLVPNSTLRKRVGNILTILGWRHRLERGQEPCRDVRDIVNRGAERGFVCMRGFGEAGDLPDELERGGMDLLLGDRRLEVDTAS